MLNQNQINSLQEELDMLKGLRARYRMDKNFVHPQFTQEKLDVIIQELSYEILTRNTKS